MDIEFNWVLLLILFPTVCGLIGWITNVVAIQMIFRPRKKFNFLGLLSFQGVLPKNQQRFAEEMASVMTSDLLTTKELVSLIDHKRLLDSMQPLVDAIFDEILTDLRALLSENQKALLTDTMIAGLKSELEKQVHAEIPVILGDIVDRADDVVDLHEYLVERLVAIGPLRLEKIIKSVADQELKFIEYYGGVFGFMIGLIQFAMVNLFPMRLALPIIGAIVGTVTNYLAIQMLFFPREPKRILFLTIQGVFPKRQEIISRSIADIAQAEFIKPDEVFALLFERLLQRNPPDKMLPAIEDFITRRIPGLAQMLETMLNEEQQEQVRTIIGDKYELHLDDITSAIVSEADSQLDIKKMVDQKITQLPKSRFELLFRGLFKEEEVYLILYGGLLGGVIGTAQLGMLYLFG